MTFETSERNGRRLRLAIVRTATGVWVGWPGGAKFFGSERTEAAAVGTAPAEVRAPMTGRVVKVPVGPGHSVEADDILVILQAMKMEYRLTAPMAGVVETVRCSEGEMVELGATLVTLAPAPEPAGAGTTAGATAPKPATADPANPTARAAVAARPAARRPRPRGRARR